MKHYPGGVHPFANAFPMITGADFAELVDSIETHGLREKIIVTADGTLVDGRNRWAALDTIGWEDYGSVTETLPEETTEEEILELIVTRNLHRRHLTASQKGMLGAELERQLGLIIPKGRPPGSKDRGPQVDTAVAPDKRHVSTAAAKAARLTGASESYVETAKAVINSSPELAEKVRQGELTLNAARTEMREAKRKERPAPVPPTVASTPAKRNPVRPMTKSVDQALSTLNGLCIALGGVGDIDPDIPFEQRAAWFGELGRHIRTLGDFRRKLREEESSSDD